MSEIRILRDCFYTPANLAKESLDLYLPSTQRPTDLLVYFHGGAWRSGDKNLFHEMGFKFAKLNHQTAIINYTLSTPPLNKIHPCHLEDCALAIKWLCQNSKEKIGTQIENIYIVGQSAGAQLAANIFLEPTRFLKADDIHSMIKGIIGVEGIYSIPNLSKKFNYIPLYKEFINQAFTTDQKIWIDASPISKSLQKPYKLCPFLIVHSKGDTLVDEQQAIDFHQHLRKIYLENGGIGVEPLIDLESLTLEHEELLESAEFFNLVDVFITTLQKSRTRL